MLELRRLRRNGGSSGHAAWGLWRLAFGALTALSLAHAPAQQARADETALPDSLEAGSAEIGPDGMVHGSGGVTLTITSLVAGATVTATADSADYDTHTGWAELWGDVSLTLVERGFTVRMSRLTYDPLMQRMEVEGISLELPLASLTAGRSEVTADLRNEEHFYNIAPEAVFVLAGTARYIQSQSGPDLVVTNARFTHSPRPDPDLFITAREVRLTTDQHVVFSGIALHIAGMELLRWGKLSRSLKPKPGLVSFSIPRFRIDREVNFMWKQGVTLNAGAAHGDLLLDYSPDYDLRVHGFAYYEPAPGSKLGVQYGTRSEVDLQRVSIERRDNLNFVYQQRFKNALPQLRDASLGVEYGRIVSDSPGLPNKGIQASHEEDTRTAVSGDVSLPLLPLGGEWFIATGAQAQWVNYDDANEEYRVAGGRAALVWRRKGFDHIVEYRLNNVQGRAVFPFDTVRERELDFITSVRLFPSWRHVIRGVYDFDADEFTTLQIGAMKRQRSFEVGMYWDLARDNAGLEFGLLTD